MPSREETMTDGKIEEVEKARAMVHFQDYANSKVPAARA
jgi:hypothetical protein